MNANAGQNQPDTTVTMIQTQTQLENRLLFTQTQRSHAFLERSREVTPLRAFMRFCAVRESRATCGAAHLHFWLNVDNGQNRLPFQDASDLVRVPSRGTSFGICIIRWRVRSEGLPERPTQPLKERLRGHGCKHGLFCSGYFLRGSEGRSRRAQLRGRRW